MDNQFSGGDASPQHESSFDMRVNNLLNNGYSFNMGSYLSEGGRVLNRFLGGYIGFVFTFLIISFAATLIPVVGGLLNSLILNPPLTAGFFIVAHRIYHNKPFEFSNFFDGFKHLGNLSLLYLTMLVLVLIIAIPYVLLKMGGQLQELMGMLENLQGGTEEPEAVVNFIMTILPKLIPLFIAIMILEMVWLFAPYIVVFGKKNFWTALTLSTKIIGKHFFSFLLFLIVIGLINVAGAMLFLVGLLYTVPLSICAIYVAYEQIVGTAEANAA